jgi:lycopene cyclase domain-containing protein
LPAFGHWLYLGGLLFSLVGCALIDYRFKLGFWFSAKAAAIAILIPVIFLLTWDFAGIALGIFFRGESRQLTGLLLAPELPVEEPVFLTLLCYSTLIVFSAFKKRLVR